jgi:hypothetical protein
LQEQVMQERIAERTVPVDLVQTQSPVYACYNTRDGWFMPVKSAGHIYVHFGDDYGTELGVSGRFRPWRNRTEVREKIEANRSQFRAFVENIIQDVDPAHMVIGADCFTGFHLGYASLIYHRDAYEFGRDLLRYLFLLEDKVRATAETLPEHPPVYHVDYMDAKMREPEKLIGSRRLNKLGQTCLRGLQDSITRTPGDPLMHTDFNLPILSMCRDYPGPWGLFAPDSRQLIIDALSEASPEGFRPVGGGWLLMDARPMAVEQAYERLAFAICA